MLGIYSQRELIEMKPKEAFALAVRIVGLLIVAYGIRYVTDFGLGLLGYFSLQRTAYAYYLIIGVAYLCVGLYLLRGASPIVRFAYPDAEGMQDDSAVRETAGDAEQIVRPERG
ncbi:MAG: hypothetical protein QOH41_562 [Blastocatellia bacterium]|jgi:hypothetical protein|nr:hypothetical protein [Blastocatellia bacterium]